MCHIFIYTFFRATTKYASSPTENLSTALYRQNISCKSESYYNRQYCGVYQFLVAAPIDIPAEHYYKITIYK